MDWEAPEAIEIPLFHIVELLDGFPWSPRKKSRLFPLFSAVFPLLSDNRENTPKPLERRRESCPEIQRNSGRKNAGKGSRAVLSASGPTRIVRQCLGERITHLANRIEIRLDGRARCRARRGALALVG